VRRLGGGEVVEQALESKRALQWALGHPGAATHPLVAGVTDTPRRKTVIVQIKPDQQPQVLGTASRTASQQTLPSLLECPR